MAKADKEGQRKAPILRFKGFTDDWEQRQLEDLLKVNSGKDYKQLDRGNVPVYGTSGYMLSVNKSLSENDAIGIGRKGTIDKPQFLKAPFWTVDTLFFLTLQHMNDLNFIYYKFQNINWKKYDESTGVPSLTKNTINKIKISIPQLNEQNKIKQLFTFLDNLLALYERKLKLLSQVKKYFLDSLFTEKEYPNLRFKGFTDAWEQRKLEEVTLFIRNGVTIKQNGSYGIPITRIESISTGTLNLSKVGYADIQTDKYKGYYLKNNDILFSNINSLEHIGKVAFVQHLSLDVIHGMNLLNIRINEKSISSKFIYYQLLIMKYNNLFKKIAKPAVNQASIAISELKKLVIKVPAVNEQCKIQALLTCLEKIITLYESKKQNLNKIKNTLLNTMFI